MAVRVYRRYVQLYPERMEEFIEYLIKQKRYDEACCKLCDIVNDDDFDSIRGKSKFDFWKLLCQLLIKNAKSIKSLNVDSIIRSGIKKYPQEIGKLWIDLAEYYVRLGQFEKARDIYNEAINTITSVKDFGIIFDSFARFEENIISMKMQQMDNDSNNDQESKNNIDIFEFDDPNDLPLRIDRLEQLYKNRAILLSSVKLRQNPHNVDEWLNRVKIYMKEDEEDEDEDENEEEIDAEKIVETFTQAIATIDPFKASGNNKLSKIWIEFGKFYEEYGNDLSDTRTIYKKATTYNFKNIDDLSSIWCEWAEMELRHRNYENCRNVLKMAIQKEKLFKSKKLWSFAIDIEESMATLEEIKSIYNRVIDTKIASVQVILNYADLLEKHEYFEESYKIYERGIELFDYPHVLPIWKTYLFKFINRYKDKKLERTRDLFEQCLNKCPSSYCKEIYLLYARFEEKYGFARHAMRVYDKACLNIEDDIDKQEMYHIYINRAADLFGITKTREIYEKAIQNLNQSQLTDICLSYISLELKLSEIDRARAIFQYCAQFANPKKFKNFWTKWHQFEINMGNQDTFKEMLRIRRSVDVMYTQITLEIDNNDDIQDNDQHINQQKHEIQIIQQEPDKIDNTTEDIDPNEIDIEDDNDDELPDLTQKAIPSSVYDMKSKIGALNRFNR